MSLTSLRKQLRIQNLLFLKIGKVAAQSVTKPSKLTDKRLNSMMTMICYKNSPFLAWIKVPPLLRIEKPLIISLEVTIKDKLPSRAASNLPNSSK